VGCELNGYEKTGYLGEENIKKDTLTGGRAKNLENMN
jgi:hypothetical protein